MPLLEITLPKTDAETKERLSKNLTKAFTDSSRFEAEIFGIRYNEYEIGQAGRNGQIWDGKNGQPYLHMVLYTARVDRLTKQRLVENFTQVFTETTGKENWYPVIHICEHSYDNIGVEGRILSDQYESCANSKFYYDVGDEESFRRSGSDSKKI